MQFNVAQSQQCVQRSLQVQADKPATQQTTSHIVYRCLISLFQKHPHTDLSNIFHCRKRSKNMLSWYWRKGSPLRYLCRSLIHETKRLACENIRKRIARRSIYGLTPCSLGRRSCRGRAPDSVCRSVDASARWTHTDWTEDTRMKRLKQ